MSKQSMDTTVPKGESFGFGGLGRSMSAAGQQGQRGVVVPHCHANYRRRFLFQPCKNRVDRCEIGQYNNMS